MTTKDVALDVIDQETNQHQDLIRQDTKRLDGEIKTLTQKLTEQEETIRRLTDRKEIMERYLSIKVGTYNSLIQKMVEELDGSLKEIVFNSKQLFQQVGLLIQPELLKNLDKILFSAEDLKNFLQTVEPLSHLTAPEATSMGFSLSYLLSVLKRIIPEYFQKDMTIIVETDGHIEGDFDLLINILRQLMMHAISNIRKIRKHEIRLAFIKHENCLLFYLEHDGGGATGNQITSEFPHLRKLINALGGNMEITANSEKGGYRYCFSFKDNYRLHSGWR